ncbi:hypothetical protein GQX73_g3009 [Xylaria multiplex]|uniref:Uncharacterized protein n=1 Tax=Xylaria multiplex TaxID=323545 RepID=A0A7C8ITE5_9PEZI|nr:hypothetical protein GQX73_g3009 [Xylaria multiplex]
MDRGSASEETAVRLVVPDIYIDMYETRDDGEFSFGTQLDTENSDQYHHQSADNVEASDWLMEATVDLSQDLETSKKELDIIKFILEEMEMRLRNDDRPSLTRGGKVEMMKACREYSSSRCGLLQERLHRVQFWVHTRMLGHQVPEKAPEEWRLVDIEWRKWLSEQASRHADGRDSTRVSPLENTLNPSNDIAWRIWGPLPHILGADIWWRDL